MPCSPAQFSSWLVRRHPSSDASGNETDGRGQPVALAATVCANPVPTGYQLRSSSVAVARYSICSNVIGTVEPLMGVVLMMICWVEGRVIEK